MLCICAEQTFSQGSARKKGFDHAFSSVLNAYMESPVRDDVTKEIGGLLEGSLDKQLVNIIVMHPFRMCGLTSIGNICAHYRINFPGINADSA